MLNKILFVLVILILAILSVMSIRDYQEYRDLKQYQEKVQQQKLDAEEAQRKAYLQSLESEIDRLTVECEKGVVAYGLLLPFEQEENEAPVCSEEQEEKLLILE